ncbi:hypothetical protein [Streptacidiphilus sp. MAP5-3]|uniref:hypothetical protein n=1 Tax=unclassified Streptacidiphilus TaxID=2643834 RepID=UPI003516CC00
MGENISNSVSGGSHGTVVQMGAVYGTVTINNGQPGQRAELPSGAWEVPASAPLLVDRSQERAGLGEWFRGAASGAARTAVVSGLHGVGKRELVRHIAHSLTDRHPEWQLYVDYATAAEVGPAPGGGPGSVVGLGGLGGDPSRALTRCLSSLGLAEEHQPDSAKEKLAEFRRRCAGKQVLVVVENAATAAQIRMLTPGVPGSAVLATSRRYLGELKLDGARLLRLGPLDLAAGAELLTALMDDPVQAAEHQAAIAEVVALCGGLPLAVQLMAARLALHPGMTPARLTEELRDESRRLDVLTVTGSDGDDPLQEGERSVRGPLDLTYRDLTPEQAAVYRAVGLLPVASFDAAVMAAALAADAEPIRGALDHLVRTCLLEAVGDGRFQVHPLVRLHARERAQHQHEMRHEHASPGPNRQAADVLARVTEHYLVLAAQADRAVRLDRLRVADLEGLLEGRPNPFAAQSGNAGPVALAWLGREREALLAVLREASRERALAELVWPLAEALVVLFLHDRRLEEWQESLRLGVDAAVAAGSDAGEARLRSLRSRPLLDLGRDDDAIRELDLAAEHAARADRPLLAASVHEMLGRYWLEHDPTRAVAVFTRTVELNLAVPDDRGTALARLFLGVALNANGEPAPALAALDQARVDLEELPTPDGRMAARARAAAGESHRLLGDLPRAAEELRQAAQALREHQATAYEADTRCLLAEVLLTLDPTDLATARNELEQARQIYDLGGNPKAATVTARLSRLDGA